MINCVRHSAQAKPCTNLSVSDTLESVCESEAVNNTVRWVERHQLHDASAEARRNGVNRQVTVRKPKASGRARADVFDLAFKPQALDMLLRHCQVPAGCLAAGQPALLTGSVLCIEAWRLGCCYPLKLIY